MKTYFSRLPQDLLINIFEYDDTYREIFKNKISDDLIKKAWFRCNDVTYTNLTYNSYLILMRIQIPSNEESLSSVRFAMPHMFEYWYNTIDKLDFYHRNYHPSDLCVTICNVGGRYYNIYVGVHDSYNCIFSGLILTHEQLLIYQTGTNGTISTNEMSSYVLIHNIHMTVNISNIHTKSGEYIQ